MHAAYPLVMAIEAWRRPGRIGRALSLWYLASMLFAAVYLEHHWVIDVLVGLAYALGVSALVTVIFAERGLARAKQEARASA